MDSLSLCQPIWPVADLARPANEDAREVTDEQA